MGIWKSLFAAESPVTREKAGLGPAGFWLSGITGSDQTIRDPFTQNAWVYAAVTRKAEALASAPLRAYVGRRGDAASQQQLPDEHPLSRLLASPSPLYASGTALMAAISASLDLYGEAPLVALTADGSAFARGALPAELYLVLPSQLQEQIDKSTGLLLGWKFGDKQWLSADQVLMIRLPNPRSQWRGLSPLAAAKQGMEFDAAAQAYNTALMRNGADPGGIIKTDKQLTEAQAAQLREAWNARHRGSQSSGKVAVLAGGLTYESISANSKDMELTSWRDWSKDEIAAVLGVTKLELADLGDFNRASTLAAREWLWNVSIIPRLRLIEDALYSWLFAPLASGRQQYWAAFDTSGVEALRANTGEKITQAQQLAQLYPLNVVNQRLELGMPEVDYGNAPPAMLAPLPESVPPATLTREAIIQIASAAALAVFEKQSAATSSAVGLVVRDRAESRAKAAGAVRRLVTAQRETSERLFFRDTRRLVVDFRELMLANIREVLGEKAINPSDDVIQRVLGPKSKWNDLTKARMKPRIEKSWKVSLKATGEEIGFPVVEPDETGAWFKRATAQTASLVQTSDDWREELGERLKATWSENGISDVREAAKVIGETSSEFAGGRAMTIARTEAGFAQSGARDEVFAEAMVDKTEWLTANDALVRSSHEAQSGEVRKRGEKFSNGLLHPHQIGGAASEVINCRCTAIPAL